jgi:hypothetical protein
MVLEHRTLFMIKRHGGDLGAPLGHPDEERLAACRNDAI